MIGRLRMTIYEALDAYKTFAPQIFGRQKLQCSILSFIFGGAGIAWLDGGNLDKAVQQMLQSKDLEASLSMEESDDPSCRVFVSTVGAQFLHGELIRSYQPQQIGQQNYDCTVWEAAKATTATLVILRPMTLSAPSAPGDKFVGGGMPQLQENNPINQVIDEAQIIWPGRQFGCIVSVGTGWTNLKPLNPKLEFHELTKTLIVIAADAKTTEGEVLETKLGGDLETSKKYFRFGVEDEIDDISLSAFERGPWMEAKAMRFLEGQAEKITACAKSLVHPTLSLSKFEYVHLSTKLET